MYILAKLSIYGVLGNKSHHVEHPFGRIIIARKIKLEKIAELLFTKGAKHLVIRLGIRCGLGCGLYRGCG